MATQERSDSSAREGSREPLVRLIVAAAAAALLSSQERQALLAERRKRAEATLAAVAEDAGIARAADVKVLAGDAARVLIEEAKKTEDASLIVVGSRGQGAIPSVILGSVSSQLVREAPCPVVVVPSISEETPEG